MKKRKFWKKFLLSFCVVVSLVSLNLRLFSVRAAANVVEHSSNVYTFGSPVTVSFASISDFGGSGSLFSGSVPSINVYSSSFGDTGRTYWYGSLLSSGSTDDIYQILYYDTSDTVFEFNFKDSRRAVLDFSLDSPIVFSSISDLRQHFDFDFGLQNVANLSGVGVTSFTIDYTYIFADYDHSTGSMSIKPVSVSRTYSSPSGNATVYFYDPQVFNSVGLSDFDTFLSPVDGNSYYVLLNAYLSFSGISVGGFYMGLPSDISPVLFNDYQTLNNSRYAGILEADHINDNISFEGISWTGWLVNAVGGFLDFEIVPGLSFAGMLGLLVGMSLFIVFLKVFSGG